MNMKILIVDDEKDILDVLRDRFEQEQFEVLLASDGSEAVKMVAQARPGIVIMDIMMPVLNGIEAKRIIRNSGCQTPIIFLTIKPMDEIADEIDDNTVFMEKPINFKQLRSIVGQRIMFEQAN